jgi:hypothetical protein
VSVKLPEDGLLRFETCHSSASKVVLITGMCSAQFVTKYECSMGILFEDGGPTLLVFDITSSRLAMGWTVQGSNPGGGEIFSTHPDWPWGPPSLLCSGYRVLPGGNVARAWC